MGRCLMISRKKSVRYVSLSFEKPNPKNMSRDLSDTIRDVRVKRKGIIYKRAQAEARKLMGIPDLHTKKFVRKHRRQVRSILSIVDGVADYIYEAAYDINGSWAYGREDRMIEVNDKIKTANQYRNQNPLLLMLIPELNEIDIEQLKSISQFILVDKDYKVKANNAHSEPSMVYNKKELSELWISPHLVNGIPHVLGCKRCGLDMEGRLV